MARIHVVLPNKLIEEIDELAGERGRSRFIADALEATVRKQKLRDLIHRGAGTIDVSKHPEWESEKVAQWVHDLRRVPSIRGDL